VWNVLKQPRCVFGLLRDCPFLNDPAAWNSLINHAVVWFINLLNPSGNFTYEQV
jgi:hypothetical protein